MDVKSKKQLIRGPINTATRPLSFHRPHLHSTPTPLVHPNTLVCTSPEIRLTLVLPSPPSASRVPPAPISPLCISTARSPRPRCPTRIDPFVDRQAPKRLPRAQRHRCALEDSCSAGESRPAEASDACAGASTIVHRHGGGRHLGRVNPSLVSASLPTTDSPPSVRVP
ncbi:hypothetical protein B0H13DRAFT_2494912 [Mycena leptocephala]|nr:hypothetical protein B0H13DRAFT_2494912 [Mycena leptocephala]